MARSFLGLVIIIGSLMLAEKCNRERVVSQHKRYLACVESGVEPIKCSFKVAFTEEKQ